VDHPRARVSPLTDPTADLHLHSTASDGALAPAAVVRRAAEVGLAAIALTDHDSLAGLDEAQAAGDHHGVAVLAGCEFSVQGPWGEVHLLAYLISPSHAELRTAIDRARAARAERARAIVALLNRLGVALGAADVERVAAGAAIGRPHVARALVARGLVGSFSEAFDRFLGRGRPAFVPKTLPSFAETTDLVRRAGGVSAAAHLGSRASREVLRAMKGDGLDAVEVRHPGHSASVRAELERVARELRLLPTGGSDWHGADEMSPSHSTIGSERIPMIWVDALRAAARERQPA
jgi:predicted metal-dependent phosphoesterase TrpH